ncbi:hypothetical protein TNCV_4872611 [Trichonephila clavipes]|nr:hypothetical protein TNCV_4872611 [Trichonephila clavipes]
MHKEEKSFVKEKKGKLAASPQSKPDIPPGSPVAAVITFIHKVLVLYIPEAESVLTTHNTLRRAVPTKCLAGLRRQNHGS